MFVYKGDDLPGHFRVPMRLAMEANPQRHEPKLHSAGGGAINARSDVIVIRKLIGASQNDLAAFLYHCKLGGRR